MGDLKTIHVLHPESNNEYELTILSPFQITVLEIIYYNTRVQSTIIKQRNER
jgi:hypothetical protein